ncbi:methylthioadenosine phosphorylase [Rhodothalassium salexigens]|uniref:S-methyl-5'-thioadenosine phosphorylase n=1 Tax=Rhodothalassium salexigens TaxID=1086 RepID=UPI0019145A8E|nr:S-methyl-5'-thioadenosine phosphorylase [Rhodothalassium salexigens]MBK5912214.1 methylthioadenosine phosphorylase [Rhodothalassium salexigens]MBK5919975.1 methylthioadenosine phosphorylase [Rhodothalassium salexigens]
MTCIGIIGGSGLYDLPGLTDGHWETVETPFGKPSDQIFRARLGDTDLAFLPRHGRGHGVNPSEINYRANIDALKRLGVTDILSMSACGSLAEDLPPGSFVAVDQFIDRTHARARSFFSHGMVAHVSMAEPTCARLRAAVVAAGGETGTPVRDGGTYVTIEGPQFSTKAESHLYRQWGAQVIGMTNMPEARLAREAEICYQTVAMVTDYDCWHEEEEAVEVSAVIRVLKDNADRARALVAHAAPRIAAARAATCPHGCDRVLDTAIITPPEARGGDALARLDAVAGRVLKS